MIELAMAKEPASVNAASLPFPPPVVMSLAPTSTPQSPTQPVLGSAAPIPVPKNCVLANPEKGIAVILCGQTQEGFIEKALPTFPALGISLVALFLSGYALRYNFTKDARSRRQSIQDDYWLRKVVSPLSIEPFVKFTSELMVGLPSLDTPEDVRLKFSHDRLSEFRALTVAFQALELLDHDLFRNIESKLEKIEDRLAKYLGELDSFAKGVLVTAPGRPEAIAELSSLRLAVLELIKEHQGALGS